jgi:peptidoglycan/LPS O-acetylase OafA/YrhL
MLLLGGASYSLYLLQAPMRALVRALLVGGLEPIGRVIYLPLMIGVSIAVFLRYEEPMRRWIKNASVARGQGSRGA